MLDRSGCQLERLHLREYGILNDPSEFRTLLAALPAVMHLAISCEAMHSSGGGIQDVLSHLILSGAMPLVPAMKELSLMVVVPEMPDDTFEYTVTDIFNSRRGELEKASVNVLDVRGKWAEWRIADGGEIVKQRWNLRRHPYRI
ncbi:hypothetical protein OE88DRAFT_1668780 [Heliocybe sulcata]|uniref:Uncharacterized protein n=1 Tax=Heliocybe sulcata TaxID=5364 RepID=A0A5C3MJX8_9AGAM|nr:hypothetical protein OE88DRAFT_1668780 [Heliocybe sulcata]